MSVFSPAQTSFAGGELSKRLRGRVDTDLYKAGLDRCENFEPLPQGSLRMRGGTRDIAALEGASSRLITFPVRNSDGYAIELRNYALRIFRGDDASGPVYGVGAELVVNGTFDLDASGWTAVSGGALYWHTTLHLVMLTLGDRMRQSVAVAAGSPYRFAATVNKISYNDPAASIRVRLGTTAGGGEIYDRTFVSGPADDVIAFDFTAPGATVYVDFEYVGSSNTSYCRVDDVSLRARDGVPVSVVTPWSSAQVGGVQFVVDSAADRMILAHPAVAPQVLTRVSDGEWTLAPIAFGASQPAEWTGVNWPSIPEFHQGRLILAATPFEPNRIRASKSGAPYDFTVGANPGDAFDFKATTKGALRWVKSGRSLLAGTDLGEHSIGAQTGLLTPSDFQVRQESAFGSASIQAVDAGDRVLYVSADRRKVRALLFDRDTDGWNSRDVTFVAEHITSGVIKEMHFARDPDGTILLVQESGDLVLATFVPGSEGIAAWWRFVIPNGSVRSSAVSQAANGVVYLWLAVERGNATRLERVPLGDAHAFLDAHTAVRAQQYVTGLERFEGQNVSLLVDGSREVDQVVAAGQVTLPDADWHDVVVGLPYRAKAVTLPREGGSPRGSAQGAKRRNVRARLRLAESAIPLVDGNRAAPTRSASTPMGSPEPPFTGDVEVTCLGWADGAVTIEQDLPSRTEILALFANTAVNDL